MGKNDDEIRKPTARDARPTWKCLTAKGRAPRDPQVNEFEFK